MLRQIMRNTREMIGIADSKAAMLLCSVRLYSSVALLRSGESGQPMRV
jgi:hypothetical protein